MSQTCRRTGVMRSPLRGDLVHRISGQLATIVSVFVRRYLVEWGGVGGSSEFLVLYGA